MGRTKNLIAAYLIIIVIGASAGLAGILLSPATAAAGHENTEYVTWVKAPAQTAAETPARFVLPELEEFVMPEGENRAVEKQVKFSDFTDVYNGRQAVDGRDRTYWEGGSFPSWLYVDMEEIFTVSKAVIQLPPSRAWGVRTQKISISVGDDGENWTLVSPEQDYEFDNAVGNAVLIEFDAVPARYVRVDITANSGAIGGQISELSIFE
jgi:hypothetical protein